MRGQSITIAVKAHHCQVDGMTVRYGHIVCTATVFGQRELNEIKKRFAGDDFAVLMHGEELPPRPPREGGFTPSTPLETGDLIEVNGEKVEITEAPANKQTTKRTKKNREHA